MVNVRNNVLHRFVVKVVVDLLEIVNAVGVVVVVGCALAVAVASLFVWEACCFALESPDYLLDALRLFGTSHCFKAHFGGML